MATAIVWFRRDLRLADNPALRHALDAAERVVPVYLYAPDDEAPWSPGAASRWWQHHSLAALADSIPARGGRLLIRRGSSHEALAQLFRETGANLVCWNRLYEPHELERERAVETLLRGRGIETQPFDANVLCAPHVLRTQSGSPYRVFTPFATRYAGLPPQPPPLTAPHSLPRVNTKLRSAPLAALELLPRIRWDAGLAQAWRPGETGARARLGKLCAILTDYAHARDQPGVEGTSRLSPHLHFGELSPRQVMAELDSRSTLAGWKAFRRELLWREFALHVLYHFPCTPETPLDTRFAGFPWRRSERLLRAWQRGETGIPIVDAGMRELWRTGWKHNRVRMITASFLTKHAGLDWRAGARWFWDTLVDADLANNTLNWQWVAGCGADAAPYFRIFNPVLQSRKFDSGGEYLRRWLPELDRLPARWLHAPWTAPAAVLATAGVMLGKNYPKPVLDPAIGRAQALARFKQHRTRQEKFPRWPETETGG